MLRAAVLCLGLWRLRQGRWDHAGLCLLTLGLCTIPALSEWVLKLRVDSPLGFAAAAFAVCANVCGETLGFYERIPWWDETLHVVWGFLAGLLYGVLQALQGGITAIGAGPLVMDYLLPFGMLCLAGLAKELPESWGIYPSIVAAALARILCHTMAGVMFWEYATMASFEYNITYLGPDTVICIVLAFLIAKPVIRFMKRR